MPGFMGGFPALKMRLAMLARRRAAQQSQPPAGRPAVPDASSFVLVRRPQPTRTPFGRMR